MAENSFNSECVPTLERAKASFEVAKEKLAKGVHAAVYDVAEPSGIPNLIKSAKNMEEGATELGKVMEDNIVSLGATIKYYNDLNEALGC